MSDLILKAHPATSFSRKDSRRQFVQFIGQLLGAGQAPYEPEPLNAGTTDLEWRLDVGNDWFLAFEREDWSLVRIRHRYDSAQALMALGGLIAYRWRMTVMTPGLALPTELAS